METYRIGWLSVRMTKEQVQRWNSGSTTRQDMFSIVAIIPSTNRGLPISDEMSLASAMEYPMVREIVKGGWEVVSENS